MAFRGQLIGARGDGECGWRRGQVKDDSRGEYACREEGVIAHMMHGLLTAGGNECHQATGVEFDFNLLVWVGAVAVDSEVAFAFFFGEGLGFEAFVSITQRSEVVEGVFGFVAARPGVGQQRDAVGAKQTLRAGAGGDEGLDDIGVAEHGCREEVDASTVFDEELGDFAAANMRRRAEGSFPISETPVPGGVDERGVHLDQFAYAFFIEV